MAGNAKKVALLALGAGFQKHATALEQEQEILAAITDIAMYALAMESTALRARKIAANPLAAEMCTVFVQGAMERVDAAGRAVVAACAEGDQLRADLARLRRLTSFAPVDAFGARRRIAARLVDLGRYVV
jgi:butyryl-CoA dehydrogenase